MKRTKNQSRKETRIMTREEEARIVALLRSTNHYTGRSYYVDVADLVEVMADTGMRLGEVLELRNIDISFEKSLIAVRLTKGSPRRVPMTRRVLAILKRRQEVGHDKSFDLHDMQVRMAWSWARERIGIEGADRLVLHSLRKTCAQRLVDAGVELRIIYAWLGSAAIRRERRLAPIPLRKLITAAEMLDGATCIPISK